MGNSRRPVVLALTVAFACSGLSIVNTAPLAGAEPETSATAVRSIAPSELGVDDLGGVTYDAASGRLVVSNRRADKIASTDTVGDSVAETALPARPDPATLSVDPRNGRRAAAHDGVNGIVAAEFESSTGRWFALVNGGTAMAVSAGAPDETTEPPTVVELDKTGRGTLRAIAPNPTDGLIYVLGDELYGVTASGELQRTVDLTGAGLTAPSDMVFAPTADATDATGAQSLFVVDEAESAGSTRLVEVALEAEAVAASETSTIIATRDMSKLSPPSPDSSGIAYLPDRDQLMVSDGEVDEMSIFQGANLYQVTRGGVLTDTGVTLPYSDEPTGVGYDPATTALYTSDDDADEVFRFRHGPDGRYGTSDDSRSSFDTRVFGARDAEDVTIDTTRGDAFIVDGVNKEVYRVRPNANGFNGLPAVGGDDTVTQFDVGVYGAVDPEGITYDAVTDHLLVVDDPSLTVYELTVTGALVRTIDVAATSGRHLAGIALAPPSGGGGGRNMYIVDRGTDNDSNPNENDGRMFEMTLPGGGGGPPPPPPNSAPTVNAGTDQSVTLPAAATLDGTVADDGLPNPPATLTPTWTKVSGPGTVAFANPGAVDTTATFSTPGTYVLRLTANDSAVSASDDVQVTVLSSDSLTLTVPVSASSDDAEENASGAMDLNSSDIELVADGPGNQTVGLRFTSVGLPKGAVIIDASVQFIVDEPDGVVTNLTIQGQAADNAPTFTSAALAVSSRPRTAASAAWAPPSWPTVGEAGPAQRTSNIAGVVQEIIDRPGWATGNAVALIITGTGQRTAEAFNSGAALAPRLHVTYTSDGQANTPPSVDAGANQSVTFPGPASLNGTVSDDGLPTPPAAVTTAWTAVSGPGLVSFANAAAVDTTATFSAVGTYVLRLTANDSARSTSDDVTVTVTAGGGGTFNLVAAVSASSDDAEEDNANGAVDLTSTDIELVAEGPRNQTVGLRFTGVTLPDNAVVQNAYVQFVTDETDGGGMALTIRGQASDNAATFTTAALNVSSRPRTGTSVGWAPPSWSTIGEAGTGQRTPNLAAIVQEIIDRPGWVGGNPLALIVTGTGRRTAEAFNAGAALAPRLHITYSVP